MKSKRDLKSRINTKTRINTKRRKRKQTRKRKVQKGGFAPCLPCLAAPAAFASAAIGGASYFMQKSTSSSSSSISRNGKNKTKKISNKSYADSRGRNNEENNISIRDRDLKYDMDIKRVGKKIYINNEPYKNYENISRAQRAFNKLIRKQKLPLKEE